MQKEVNRLLKHLSQEKLKKNFKECAELCNIIGGVYSETGCHTEALVYHQEALEHAIKIGNVLSTAVSYRALGECRASLGSFREAVENIQRYLELANKSCDKIEVQRAWTTLGRVYLMQAQARREDAIPNTELDLKTISIAKTAEQHFLKAMKLAEGLRENLDNDKKEFAQMQSGLLQNLGSVNEICGKYTECIMKLHSAMQICKNAKLKEDLLRIQLVTTEIHRKKKNIKYAVKSSEEAYANAKSIGKKLLIVEALLEKGLVQLHQNDYKSAKRTFAQAYREKSPSEEDHLRAIKMTKLAHLIFVTQMKVTDFKLGNDELIQQFDKLGDLFSTIGLYGKAVECYKRAYTQAKVGAKGPNELARLLYSIAETYADDGKFQNAINYYTQELACRDGNNTEQCQTLLKIAHMMEYANSSTTDVVEAYERAYTKAKDNHKLMYQVLKDFVPYMKKKEYNMSRAEELDNVLLNLRSFPEIVCEVENDSSNEALAIDLDDEIANIDDIITDDENDEECGLIRPARNARGCKRVKANEMGESPLHEACIKGDLRRVKILVDTGHDLNPRDNFGWTPLHEACNNGHYEIVEFLVDRGADVLDRGPKGVSPLHDAAANGHWHIMRLLIKHGANVISLTDKGETVLACLREFKKEHQHSLTNDQMYECRQMELELLNEMDKYGYNVMEENIKKLSSNVASRGIGGADDAAFERSRQRSAGHNAAPSTSALTVKQRLSSVEASNIGALDASSSVKEYKSIISTLKRRQEPFDRGGDQPAAKKQPQPSLYAASQSTSIPTKDWLIDDVSRNRVIENRRSAMQTFLSSEFGGDDEDDDEDEDDDIGEIVTRAQVCAQKKQKVAVSKPAFVCIESDDEDDVTEPPPRPSQVAADPLPAITLDDDDADDVDSKFSEEISIVNPLHQQQSIFSPKPNNDENDDNTNQSAFSASSGGKMTASIFIEGRKMLVPLPDDYVTIGWLRRQVAQRYAAIVGAEAEFKLMPIRERLDETTTAPQTTPAKKNKAELEAVCDSDDDLLVSDNDLLLDVTRGSRRIELRASVVSWKLASLCETYARACGRRSLQPDERVERELRALHANVNKLDLAHCRMPRAHIAPLLEALARRPFDAASFCGSQAFLETDDDANEFVRCVASLSSLTSLNLRCVGLRTAHLKLLCETMRAPKLVELDVGYNLLGFESRVELDALFDVLRKRCPNVTRIVLGQNAEI